MHRYAKAVIVLSFLVLGASPLQAQSMPWSMGVDSSVRAEFMFATQNIKESSPPKNEFDRFKLDTSPRMPVVSAAFELTPIVWASGRLAGSLSVWEPEINRLIYVAPGAGMWNAKPQYSLWEAAGLFHLWNAGGYRFSAVGGYRSSVWKYSGWSRTQPRVSTSGVFASHIPFIGLQTSMYLPCWKASFEILGSNFMSKTVDTSLFDTYSAVFHANADRGGLLEFRMEGTVSVAPNVLCGLSGRLTYEEVFGSVDWLSNGTNQTPFAVRLLETVGTFGLDLTVLF